MKLLILAIFILAFGCKNKEDEDLKKAKDLIELSKKNYTADSLAIEDHRKLEEAKIRAGDTLRH